MQQAAAGPKGVATGCLQPDVPGELSIPLGNFTLLIPFWMSLEAMVNSMN